MNGGVSGGLAAGIAQGILQRKARDRALEEQQKQLELAKPMQDLQKQLLQLQIANQKTQQAKAATQNKFFDLIFQRMQGTGGGQPQMAGTAGTGDQTTPIRGMEPTGLPTGQQPAIGAESAGSGVIDMMLQMDPMSAAVMKNITGIDLPGAGRAAEMRRHNLNLEQMATKRLAEQQRANDIAQARLLGQYKMVEVETPGGGTKKVAVPNILGPSTPSLSIQTRPSKKAKPIPESDLPLWINTKTLETPKVGMSSEQAQAQGFKRITTGQRDKLDSIGSVGKILSKVENLMQDVFPKTETLLQRIGGAATRKAGAFTQTNTEAAKLEKLLNGTLAPIIRSLGEKGALSDGDVKRAISLFPRLTDDADVAWGAIEQIKDIIAGARSQALGVSDQGPDMIFNVQTGRLEPAK